MAVAVAGLLTFLSVPSTRAEERKFVVWLANLPKSRPNPTAPLPNRDDIRAQYFDLDPSNDFDEPFTDVDGDGLFDPTVDTFVDTNGNGVRDLGIRSFAEYWAEVSYGDVTISTNDAVLGWINLPWPLLPLVPTPPDCDPFTAQNAMACELVFTDLDGRNAFNWGFGEEFDESRAMYIVDPDGALAGPTTPGPGVSDNIWTPGERFRDSNGDGRYDALFEPIGDSDGDGIIDTSDPNPLNHEFLDIDGDGARNMPEPFEDFMIRWDAGTEEWVPVTDQYILDNYPGNQTKLKSRKSVPLTQAPELVEDVTSGQLRTLETHVDGVFVPSDIGSVLQIWSASLTDNISGQYTVFAVSETGSAVTVLETFPGSERDVEIDRDIMITPDVAFIEPGSPSKLDSGTAGAFVPGDAGALLEIGGSAAGNSGNFIITSVFGGGKGVNIGQGACLGTDGLLAFQAYEGAEPDPDGNFPAVDLDDPPDGINLGGAGDEFIDVNASGSHDAALGVSVKVLTRIVLNPDGRGNNGCYDPPDMWTELGNTKMQNLGIGTGPGFATRRPPWLGEPFNALEPLIVDVNGDGFYEPADGDTFDDLNGDGVRGPIGEAFTDIGNGRRDPSEDFDDVGYDRVPGTNDVGEGDGMYNGPEALVCDLNGNGLLDAGDIFDSAVDDLNGNGTWDSGEPFVDGGNGRWDNDELFSDLNNNGTWDAAELFNDRNRNCQWDPGENFDDRGNGVWDPGERLTDDRNGNGQFEPGDQFVDEGNRRWDDDEPFTDRNLNNVWDAAEPFVDANGNGSRDAAFVDLNFDGEFTPGWWQERYGTSPPDWRATIPNVSAFDPTAAREFNPNGGSPDTGGDIFPDVTGMYDGYIEFDDLPSSIYHTLGGGNEGHGGDLRLGEVTSPTPLPPGVLPSIFGESLPSTESPFAPDRFIRAAGPRAVDIHGDGGHDAGNQLAIEMLTWRSDGASGTEPRFTNTVHPFNSRPDFPGFRDWTLDGLFDQGETREAGTENYVVDVAGANRNDGADEFYPFNRKRLMEDLIEALDTDVDWDVFVDQGAPQRTGFRAIDLTDLSALQAPGALLTGVPGQFRATDIGSLIQIQSSLEGNDGFYRVAGVSPDGADVEIDTFFGTFANEGPPLEAFVTQFTQGGSRPPLGALISGLAILPPDAGAQELMRRPASVLELYVPIPTRDADTPFFFSDIVSGLDASIEGATISQPGPASVDALTAFAAHEYLHTWEGYPDLYDYDVFLDGIAPINTPVGPWDIMAGGGLVHPSPILKTLSGWIDPIDLTTVLLPNVPQTVFLPATEFIRDDAFFYMENPVFPGERLWFWSIANQGFSSSLPWDPAGFQTGMLVMHTDIQDPFLVTAGSNPEAIPNQQRIESHFTYQIVQADGLQELEAGQDQDGDAGVADPGDPFPGRRNVTEFNANTDPSSRWFSGAESGVDVLNVVPVINPTTGAEEGTQVTFLWTPREVPTLRFEAPPGGEVVGADFIAVYEAFDLFGGTSIEFFIDTDDTGFDGVSLNPSVPVTKPAGFVRDTFSFDITGLPNDVYFLYARLTPGAGADASQEAAASRVRASNRNEGDGRFRNDAVTVNLATSKVESWTILCIDDTTEGSERWSVTGTESDRQAGNDAITGVPYTSNGGEVTFEIEAGGLKRFRIGDRFTFLTTGLTPYSKRFEILNGGTVPQPTAVVNVPQCPAPPLACSDVSPFAVRFDARGSSDPNNQTLSYQWDFGDGTPPTPFDPAAVQIDHTFASPGTFTVRLTVRNLSGRVDTDTTTIIVTNLAPVASIVARLDDLNGPVVDGPIARGTNDGTVTVFFDGTGSTDPNGDPLTDADFVWSFGDPASGDANNAATGRTTSHTYVVSGTYQVTLTVTDPSGAVGTDNLLLDINVNQSPVIEGVTVAPRTGPAPLPVTFEVMASDADGDALLVTWDFGEGAPEQGLIVTHTYAQSGTFTATLTVDDQRGGLVTQTFTITVTSAQVLAAIAADPTSGPPGTTVAFDAAGSSTGATFVYEWDFGDGSAVEQGASDQLAQISHTYDREGVFTATLTVRNTDDGTSNNAATTITISAPVVDFSGVTINGSTSGEASGPEPFDVTLDASSVAGAVDWAWDFGDGATAQGAAIASHTYVQRGSYTVRLTVTTADGGTVEADVARVVVTCAPVGLLSAVIAADSTSGPVGATIEFDATGSSTGSTIVYEWDFGDGSAVVQGPPATHAQLSHLYGRAGVYTVTLDVRDTASGATQCAVETITIGAMRPPIDFSGVTVNGSTSGVASGPQPFDVSLDATSVVGAVDWVWNFGDGTMEQGSPTVSHTYPQLGSFTVRLRVTTADGDSAEAVVAQVNVSCAPPGQVKAAITADRTSGEPGIVNFDSAGSCTGATIVYEWNFGDGSSVVRGTPATHAQQSHRYNREGDYIATLDVRNTADGATARASVAITITIADSGGGGGGGGGTPPVIDFGSVTVNGSTSDVASGPEPFGVNLDARGVTGAVDWFWDFGDGTTAQGTGTVSHTYVQRGTYTVRLRVTTTGGQTAEEVVAQIAVSADPAGSSPVARVQTPSPPSGVVPLTVQFSAEGTTDSENDIIEYRWDFGDGTATVVGARATHIYRAANTYTVTLTVTDATGRSDSARATVDVLVDTGPSPGQPLPDDGDPGDGGSEPPPLFPMCGFGSLLGMMASMLGLMGMKVVRVRRRRGD